MAKVGACLLVVGLGVGGLTVALYLARLGDLRQGGALFDASPYVVWGGIAGVAVTCGTVLLAATEVIVALGKPEAPAPRKHAGTADRARNHYE